MKPLMPPGVCSLSPHIELRETGLPLTAVRAGTPTRVMDGGDVTPWPHR